MNKIGIHYAYWGSDWDIDLIQRIRQAARVGFEVIDITPPQFMVDLDKKKIGELLKASRDYDVELSFCIGFPKSKDMSSSDAAVRRAGIEHSKRMIEAVSLAGGTMLSGILYSAWPYLYDHTITREMKEAAIGHGLASVREVLPTARDHGIRYAVELVNRFEQYILNSVDEGLAFCDARADPAVGLLVDVFHANIEEDNIADSIRKTGDRLFHLHVSENNRRLPGSGRHIPWDEVFQALKDIDYQGHIVMEPFLEAFDPVGNDLRIWRDLESDLSEAARDGYAREAIAFVREKMGHF